MWLAIEVSFAKFKGIFISTQMKKVRAKKNLGQHFLKDNTIAQRIVDAMKAEEVEKVLEVGPGMGVLTDILLERTDIDTHVIEIDTESVAYLNANQPKVAGKVIMDDFLKMDFDSFSKAPFAIIGNFPYNISSQIYFKVYDNRDQITEVVGMLQKEVAERIASKPGSKVYGILSVLIQAYYDVEYLFTVHEDVFDPPPRVKSGVLRIKRNNVKKLACDERLFKNVIKLGFNQRRKTLRNSLKSILADVNVPAELLAKRPEQLSVAEFVELVQYIEKKEK